jgi:glycosyltransferase involved in cell wall biosynthesis
MRVCHLNTRLEGGAAQASRRLHESLLRVGVDSTFRYLSERKTKHPDRSDYSPIESGLTWYKQLLVLLLYRIEKRALKRSLHGRTPGNELFSFPYGKAPLTRETTPQDSIIHLHWIPRLIDYPRFFDTLAPEQPIAWTLHDMFPFTGGCHFDFGCGKFRTGCGGCPQLVLQGPNDLSKKYFQVKHRALKANLNLHVVAPSHWLLEQAKASPLFQNVKSFHHIPYGLMVEDYQRMEKSVARANLGLPLEAMIIGFGADGFDNRRKGFHLMIEALEELHKTQPSPSTPLRAIVFGNGQIDPEVATRLSIHYCGYLSNRKELSAVYSACDLFVLPSIEDNLPQTGMESMACGTPVVAFETGGVPDFVRPGVTGGLAHSKDSFSLADCIRRTLASSSLDAMRENCVKMIQSEFSWQQEARYYTDLYQSITDNRELPEGDG